MEQWTIIIAILLGYTWLLNAVIDDEIILEVPTGSGTNFSYVIGKREGGGYLVGCNLQPQL